MNRFDPGWHRRGPTILLASILWTATCLAETSSGPLQLTLPPAMYAVPGVEMNIYFDNVILTETSGAYRFQVTCDIGTSEERRWTLLPAAADVGEHPLTIAVSDSSGKELGRAATVLRIVPADAGAGRSIRLLIVGDSLTHATVYANEMARLLSLPGNPRWTMLGSHRPPQAADGVAHEGYGGWTWNRFLTHHEPNPDGTYRKRSSPFVYLGDDGRPVLDLKRYFDEACGGERPDFVTILLGINDCFGADPEDPAKMDTTIDSMLANADTLLAAFREAAPDAELGICLTPPPNSREEGFQANYQGKYHRWGWKRIQHRLVQRELSHFADRENVFIVPIELNLDPVDGYPVNNGVHPNASGYRQVGASIYAWLKMRLREQSKESSP